MRWLSDQAIERLRGIADAPDLSGTRYRVLERVARGGMGTVYLAEDTALGRRVALKVLDVPEASSELAARLLREAQILAFLEHPGIVPVHDVGTLADGRVFYTMKFVQGKRLDQHILHLKSLPDRLRIFQKICDAVAFAHAHGVLHRDLKPENIMVGPFGEVLVMDWGVAKILDRLSGLAEEATDGARGKADAAGDPGCLSASPPARGAGLPGETVHGTILGTPGYMAPEQARGEIKRIDQRADIFALGAILRFLLTGHSPQDATTAGAANESAPGKSAGDARSATTMPRALAAVGTKAMTHDPAGRYASVEELATDVAHFLDGLPVAAYPENVFVKAGRLVWRHRAAVFLVLAYLLMRIVLLIWTER